MLRRRLSVLVLATAAVFSLYVLLGDGYVANVVYRDSHPSFDRASADSREAVVFFTGAQSYGSALAAPMVPVWMQHGDVVVVNYPRYRFDSPTIARDTYRYLQKNGYQRVTLIGGSLGGELAVDLIEYQRAHHGDLQLRVILADTPAGVTTLFMAGIATHSHWFRPGPLDNLATRLYWRAVFRPETPSQRGRSVDPAQLATLHAAAKTWALSSEQEQVRYIVDRPPPTAGTYIGIRMMYLQSTHDKVVRPQATPVWANAFPGATVISVPGAWHIDFVEHPEEWRNAFTKAFAALGPWA